MKTRQCLWCKTDISHKRKGAKFCDATCRSHYFKITRRIFTYEDRIWEVMKRMIELARKYPEFAALAVDILGEIENDAIWTQSQIRGTNEN